MSDDNTSNSMPNGTPNSALIDQQMKLIRSSQATWLEILPNEFKQIIKVLLSALYAIDMIEIEQRNNIIESEKTRAQIERFTNMIEQSNTQNEDVSPNAFKLMRAKFCSDLGKLEQIKRFNDIKLKRLAEMRDSQLKKLLKAHILNVSLTMTSTSSASPINDNFRPGGGSIVREPSPAKKVFSRKTNGKLTRRLMENEDAFEMSSSQNPTIRSSGTRSSADEVLSQPPTRVPTNVSPAIIVQNSTHFSDFNKTSTKISNSVIVNLSSNFVDETPVETPAPEITVPTTSPSGPNTLLGKLEETISSETVKTTRAPRSTTSRGPRRSTGQPSKRLKIVTFVKTTAPDDETITDDE